MALGLLSNGLLKLGRPAEALDAYGRADTLTEKLTKENPADKGYPAYAVPIAGRSRAGPLGSGRSGPARRPTSVMVLRLSDRAAAAGRLLRLSAIAYGHAALAGLAGQRARACRPPRGRPTPTRRGPC